MPLKHGVSSQVVSQNIKEMMKAGHKKSQAVAAALSMKRKSQKMAEGGMVEDNDLDDEHERSLNELMIQGDQPPVANPEEQDMEKKLAIALHNAHEKEEYMYDGGMVEGMSGNEEPEVMHSSSEEPMEEEMGHEADAGHSVIEGVPMSMALSEEAKKAIEAKKKKRQFIR